MKMPLRREMALTAAGLFLVWLLVALLDTAALWLRGLGG
ncbi:MAG: hypothetical protein KatS3mg072_1086 [Meiothermus sp.]|nr:MAG: hypothetical protein KatS3mg072_1086 [Meiothermus sp.]